MKAEQYPIPIHFLLQGVLFKHNVFDRNNLEHNWPIKMEERPASQMLMPTFCEEVLNNVFICFLSVQLLTLRCKTYRKQCRSSTLSRRF